MRPDTKDAPPRRPESAPLPPISSAVRFKLLRPPLGVLCRPRAVADADVPEAGIDEDGDPEAPENEVARDKVDARPNVNLRSGSDTEMPESPSERSFGGRPRPAVRLH